MGKRGAGAAEDFRERVPGHPMFQAELGRNLGSIGPKKVDPVEARRPGDQAHRGGGKDRGRGRVREFGDLLSQQRRRPNAVYVCDALLQFVRHIRRAGGGNILKILRGKNDDILAALLCALDLNIGAHGIGVDPRQGHRTIIECFRAQILRGKRRGVGLADDTRSIDALRPGRAVPVLGAHARKIPASGESEKQHQRNEDRRSAQNEDEPVHENQDADCCGEASGLPGCEWAAPPTRVMNSRRLMGLTPSPRITTQS
jgi:hypothetical protein